MTILASCAFIGAVGFAGEGGITLRSLSGDRGIVSGNTERIAVLILWFLVAAIVLTGIISSSANWTNEKLNRLGKGPDASNLFLGVEFLSGQDESTKQTGYLRSLGMREATFVSPTPILKGSRIRFNLYSLPGYHGENGNIAADVQKCRSMGGAPQHFLVRVRFNKMSDGERKNLLDYVDTLATHRSAYSRA